jgi:hypothetical protein
MSALLSSKWYSSSRIVLAIFTTITTAAAATADDDDDNSNNNKLVGREMSAVASYFLEIFRDSYYYCFFVMDWLSLKWRM